MIRQEQSISIEVHKRLEKQHFIKNLANNIVLRLF